MNARRALPRLGYLADAPGGTAEDGGFRDLVTPHRRGAVRVRTTVHEGLPEEREVTERLRSGRRHSGAVAGAVHGHGFVRAAELGMNPHGTLQEPLQNRQAGMTGQVFPEILVNIHETPERGADKPQGRRVRDHDRTRARVKEDQDRAIGRGRTPGDAEGTRTAPVLTRARRRVGASAIPANFPETGKRPVQGAPSSSIPLTE